MFMKRIYSIIIILLLIVFTITICSIVYHKDNNIDNTIPTDYIMIFKGESAEVVNTTYIYEIKKKKKISYKYINTISIATTYDSSSIEEKIKKKGTITKKKKIFEIAEKHDAYSYVKYIKEDKIYSIEEFKNIFK